MKEAFIVWIVWQLLLIGWASAKISNEIVDKTYKCVSAEEKISVGWSIAMPLVSFVPEQSQVTEYCKDNLTNDKDEQNF